MLGKKIKEFRQQRNITREDLAEHLNISKFAVAKYEQGQREPNLDTIKKIAEVLEVSANDLLGTPESINEFNIDFDIRVFDEEVLNYIFTTKKLLNEISNSEITNTIILQNIIINRIAEETALKKLGMYPNKALMLEYELDEQGNLRTGIELRKRLQNYYLEVYEEEKLDSLKKTFNEIVELDEKSLDETRKYYNDIQKHKIPKYILEKLYPDYINKLKAIETKKREKAMKTFLDGILKHAEDEISKGGNLEGSIIELLKEYKAYYPELVIPDKLEQYLKKY